VTRRRGRRRKKLLDDLKDRRGYCQLKEEALDGIMWRNRFGRDFGPVVWQIADDDLIDNTKEVNSLKINGNDNVSTNACVWTQKILRFTISRFRYIKLLNVKELK